MFRDKVVHIQCILHHFHSERFGNLVAGNGIKIWKSQKENLNCLRTVLARPVQVDKTLIGGTRDELNQDQLKPGPEFLL